MLDLVKCSRALVRVALVVCLLVPASAYADEHFIGPGHEQDVLDLLAPHALGEEITEGHLLSGVSIERTSIHISVRSASGTEATLVLRHPDGAPDAARRTRSFVLVHGRSGVLVSSGMQCALESLATTIERNDEGGFWTRAAPSTPARSRALVERVADVQYPLGGVVFIMLLTALALALAIRLLHDAHRYEILSLALAVAVGAFVRLLDAPRVFLGAWPWSRLYPHIRSVATSDSLAALSAHTGTSYFLTDVMMWTNFAYAALMPLVLFSHATHLLRDRRAGLIAAFAVALLP